MDISKKVNLTKYLKYNVKEDDKENYKIKVHDLNVKIANYIDYLFNKQPQEFQILLEYCRNAQKDSKQSGLTTKFDIVKFASFIEYTNYYNLTKDDFKYFETLERELEEHFDRMSIKLN